VKNCIKLDIIKNKNDDLKLELIGVNTRATDVEHVLEQIKEHSFS